MSNDDLAAAFVKQVVKPACSDKTSESQEYGSREQLEMAIRAYGEKYGIVLSVKNSCSRNVHFICKHSGFYSVANKNTSDDNVDEEKRVIKKSSKIGCPCYVKIKTTKMGGWIVSKWSAAHSHSIPQARKTYYHYRIQSSDVTNKIGNPFKAGLKVGTIVSVLASEGIDNIIPKDVENMQYNFFNSWEGRPIYDYITQLQDKRYVVNYKVDTKNQIDSVFFCHESSILKARRMPENIIIDATYKTNKHKLVYVNIVGTSNQLARKSDALSTFEIAAAWVSNETQESYKWVMNSLKKAIWPEELQEKIPFPSIIVTDNDAALRGAIKHSFPMSRNILCYIHLQRNFQMNLMKHRSESDKDKKALIKLDIETMFQKIALKAGPPFILTS